MKKLSFELKAQFLFLFLTLACGLRLSADAPPGYYVTAEGQSGQALRSALHQIIHDHRVIPYSGGATDVTAALKILDQDPNNTNNVILIYSGRSDPAAKFNAADGWNREHLWCNSYGLDSIDPAYSDLFNLRPEDVNVNSARGNKYYDTSNTNDANYANPATPDALLAMTDTDSWEPPEAVKGAIARSLFYMDVRYEGDRPNEQDLKLTDATGRITSSTNFMGSLQTLLAWHASHPVDDAERRRNDLIFLNYQGNRNPFIDHPEWVVLTFNSDAPVITGQPQNLAVHPGEDATFTVLASGAAPLSYQWLHNDTNITDAVTNFYTIANVQARDVGTYSVLVSNSVSSVISTSATLSLKPSIAGLIPINGDSLSENFDSMGAGGTNTPSGWYVGTGTGALSGTNVTVGTGSSLTGGNYNFGTAGSTDRALGSLASSSTQRDTEGRFVNDTSSYIVAFTLSYTGEQWRVGGTNSVNNDLVMQYSTNGTIFRAMGSQFDFNTPVGSGSVGPLDGNNPANRLTGIGGTYAPAQPVAPGKIFYLRWADADSPSFDHAMAIDDLAMTFVFSNPPPVIVTQPQSVTVNQGGTASFSVVASGNENLSYQWTFNTTNLISGAIDSSLTLTNVQATNAGVYAVIVSNGSATTSSNATLVVNHVPVGASDHFNRLADFPFTIRIP